MENESISRLVSSNEFLRKYLEALYSVSKTLRDEKPDYIIALSRKAPHILELMQLLGIWQRNSIVISEKAIDFMGPEEVSGSRIIIFDDIIIAGSTIKQLLSRLSKKYKAEFKVVTIAIDEDTIAVEKDDEGYAFVLEDGKKIYIDFKVALNRDERFIFSSEIVRSFAFLNKPYDMDYSTLHVSIDPDVLTRFLRDSQKFRSYDLTTVYQSNNGFRRYTFISSKESREKRLFRMLLNKMKLHLKICKVRAYYDKRTSKMTLAPMVTFSMSGQLLKERDLR